MHDVPQHIQSHAQFITQLWCLDYGCKILTCGPNILFLDHAFLQKMTTVTSKVP